MGMEDGDISSPQLSVIQKHKQRESQKRILTMDSGGLTLFVPVLNKVSYLVNKHIINN